MRSRSTTARVWSSSSMTRSSVSRTSLGSSTPLRPRTSRCPRATVSGVLSWCETSESSLRCAVIADWTRSSIASKVRASSPTSSLLPWSPRRRSKVPLPISSAVVVMRPTLRSSRRSKTNVLKTPAKRAIAPSAMESRISRERSFANALRSLVAMKVPTTLFPATMGAPTNSVGCPLITVATTIVRFGGRCSHRRTRGLASSGPEPGVVRRLDFVKSMTTTSPAARA